MSYYAYDTDTFRYISHHGVLGQKWGVRRYQNPDGTLTTAGKKHLSDRSEKVKTNSTVKRTAPLSSIASRTILNGTSGGGGIAGSVMDREVETIEKEMEELIKLGNEIEGNNTIPSGFASSEYMALLTRTQKEMAALSAQYKAATDNAQKKSILKEMKAKKEAVAKARKAEVKQNKKSVGASSNGSTSFEATKSIGENWVLSFTATRDKKK